MDAKLLHMIGSKKFLKGFVFILLGLISIGMFRLFQIKYNFLGDMDIRVRQTLKRQFLDTQFLVMYIMFYIHRISGLIGIQAFQWVSYISGGAFITVLF